MERVAVQTFSVGGADQEGPHFSHIAAAAVGPAGELVVVDRMLPSVFLFDARGSLLRSIGRKGQGPGEFETPVDAGFHGDSLWVWDQRLFRLTWFDPLGGTLSDHPFPREQLPGSPWLSHGGRPLSSGTFLLRVGISSQIAADTVLPVPVLLLDGQGQRRLVAELPAEHSRQAVIPFSGSDRQLFMSQPISAQPIVEAESGGSWFFTLRQPVRLANEPVVTITRYDPTGREIDDFAISFTPRPMTRGARGALTDNLLEAMPPALRPELERSQVERAWWVPEIFPPVQQAFADSSGFWLRREGFPGVRDPAIWQRYDLRGRLVASVQLPGDLHGLTTTPTSIVGVRHDALGVPLLHWYEVR